MNKKLRGILSKGIAEFLGTFAIVFFGCGTIASFSASGLTGFQPYIPVVFGLTVALMIYATGHISGAHFNPAVTLAFFVVGRFPKHQLGVYWVAQFLGGIAAAYLLSHFVPDATEYGATDYGVTMAHVSIISAIFIESVLTFFLMFVIMAVATDSRAVGTMAGAAIGMVVTVDAFFAGSLTGASMNPARSLGPALVFGGVGEQWIYFVGPSLGAIAAAWTYEFVKCEPYESRKKDESKGCC